MLTLRTIIIVGGSALVAIVVGGVVSVVIALRSPAAPAPQLGNASGAVLGAGDGPPNDRDPAPTVVMVHAFHAPNGASAGEVYLTGPVVILQRDGVWAQFQTPHMEQPAWALAVELGLEAEAQRPPDAPLAVLEQAPQPVEVAAVAPRSSAPPAGAAQHQVAPLDPLPGQLEPLPPAPPESAEQSAGTPWYAAPSAGCDADPTPLVCSGAADPAPHYHRFDCTAANAAGPVCVPAGGSGSSPRNPNNPKPTGVQP
jgi:hypothetical protein